MLGHRGCRLAITYPEIPVMQVTAIVEAAIACRREGVRAMPEIMIPLVGSVAELTLLRGVVEDTIDEVVEGPEYTGNLEIPIGTMIEVPRAALTAGEIAEVADFFSFGTNDLTQMTYGFSRDDINSFLPDYLAQGVLTKDPFFSLDQTGVGRLVRLATRRAGRQTPSSRWGSVESTGGGRVHRILPQSGAGLCELFFLPGPGGSSWRRPRRSFERRRLESLRPTRDDVNQVSRP